jgi:predicted HTH transcriptional regulator
MIGFNTESQFGEKFGITTRGVEKSILELKKTGLVEREGAARGGYWVVMNK